MKIKLVQVLKFKDIYNTYDLSSRDEFTREGHKMRLNQASDYALRVLIFVASSEPKLAKISDISKRYHISRAHLMKIVNKLSRAGLLETVRGRNGGLRLNSHARDIRIGHVVRVIEEDFALVECLHSTNNTCIISPACKLSGIFAEALAEFMSVLDKYTLADVTHNRFALQNILFARVIAREKNTAIAYFWPIWPRCNR